MSKLSLRARISVTFLSLSLASLRNYDLACILLLVGLLTWGLQSWLFDSGCGGLCCILTPVDKLEHGALDTPSINFSPGVISFVTWVAKSVELIIIATTLSDAFSSVIHYLAAISGWTSTSLSRSGGVGGDILWLSFLVFCFLRQAFVWLAYFECLFIWWCFEKCFEDECLFLNWLGSESCIRG